MFSKQVMKKLASKTRLLIRRHHPWLWIVILCIFFCGLILFSGVKPYATTPTLSKRMMVLIAANFIGGAVFIGWLGGYHSRISVTVLGAILFRASPEITSWIAYPENSILAYSHEFSGIVVFHDICTLTLAVIVACVVHGITRAYRRIPLGHCQSCGYNLFANTSGICPECGTPIPDETKEKLAAGSQSSNAEIDTHGSHSVGEQDV